MQSLEVQLVRVETVEQVKRQLNMRQNKRYPRTQRFAFVENPNNLSVPHPDNAWSI